MNLIVESADGATANGVPPLFKYVSYATSSICLFRTDKIKSIIRATDGDKVTLAAELTQGSEPVQIRWLRNKMTITNSLSFQYTKEGQAVKLQVLLIRHTSYQFVKIADAFPEDAGEYHVEAKNAWGVAKCIMRLDIQSEWLFILL